MAGGMDLIAHLRDEAGFARGGGDDPHFGNGMRQRFLAIDMPPALQRRQGGHSVRMVRRSDHHRVNVLLLEHFSEVRVAPGVGKFLLRRIQEKRINIANGNDVLVLDSLDISGGAIGGADDGDVEFFVGRNFPEGGACAQQPGASRRDCGMCDKLTAIQAMIYHKLKAKGSIITATDG